MDQPHQNTEIDLLDATASAAEPMAADEGPASASSAPAGKGISCSHCGSKDVRPSHKQASQSGHAIYRCRACKHHFKVKTKAWPRPSLLLGAALSLLLLGGLTVAIVLQDAASEVEYATPAAMLDDETLARLLAKANNGDAAAQWTLGQTYWQREQHQQAIRWLQAAAASGHAEAQYLLGQAYLYGRGTVQSYRAAMEQFTKAATSGNVEAEYQLGIFHRDGLAAPPDKEAAYLWLNLAAAQGHAEALMWRDKLTTAMTGEQILRAQEASAEVLKRLTERKTALP